MFFDVDIIAVKACILASLYPFCLLVQNKKIRISLIICFLIAALLFRSRALFCIIIIIFLYSEAAIFKKINKWSIILIGMLSFFVVIYINTNSVIGRLFIWKNILNNFGRVPWNGLGYNTFKFYYAEWQANYFIRNEAWSKYHFVADAPSFAFNELLHSYVEYGIASVIVSLLFIYFNIRIMIREKIPILQTLSLSNLCIFSFALVSYPLHSIWILFLLFINHILMFTIRYKRTVYGFVLFAILFSFILIDYYKFTQAKEIWLYAKSLPINANQEKEELYGLAYTALHRNQYFLYEYSLFLLNEQKSNEVLLVGSNNRIYFNQYEYSLLMGNAYLQNNNVDSAKTYLLNAHYIIPNRLIPLHQLLNIAKASQDTFQIRKYAEMIIATPIKIASPVTTKIKREAQVILNR